MTDVCVYINHVDIMGNHCHITLSSCWVECHQFLYLVQIGHVGSTFGTTCTGDIDWAVNIENKM